MMPTHEEFLFSTRFFGENDTFETKKVKLLYIFSQPILHKTLASVSKTYFSPIICYRIVAAGERSLTDRSHFFDFLQEIVDVT